MRNDPDADRPLHHLAVKLLAWIAVGTVLYVGKPALAPLLFAMLLAILLSPLVDWLERRRAPRALAAALSVGVLLVGMGLLVDVAWSPTIKWIDDVPAVLQTVERKIRPLQRVVARIESLTSRATSITTGVTSSKNAATLPAMAPDRLDTLSITRTLLIDIATVAILTVLLLMAGARTLRSIEALYIAHGIERGYRYQWLRIVESVRSELGRYFATLALINVGLGVVTTGVMALWGLPSPWLWGIMVAVLNFVPYVGPTISLGVLSVVALVSFAGYGPALGVAGSFLLITAIEGQLIQPLLVGYRLNLNPIMLFLAIWLGGWFWGVAGVLLATPVLIALKEIANHQTGDSVLKAVLNAPNVAPTLVLPKTPAPIEE
jgi:predicted PurR-regulated permease PerM